MSKPTKAVWPSGCDNPECSLCPDAELLEELQGEISDHMDWGGVTECLECAESCEVLSDYTANIEDAIAAAEKGVAALRLLLARAKGEP